MGKNKYTLAVLGAGTLWGFMGFFRRTLDTMGLSASNCIAVRGIFAALLFGIAMLITDRKAFKVKLRDAWCFLGSGIVSLLLFSLCYFKAMDYMSLSNAAILLYTAPCFVILFSALLFNEKKTARKLAAMLIAFAGCCLVSGIGTGSKISTTGILFGLGSGICYALFSIFSRFAINCGYSTFTINFYTCLLAGLGALIVGGVELVPIITSTVPNFLFVAATGLVTCYLPYLLYTYGLSGLSNGKASIMASIEPVVATLVGVTVYSEKLSLAGGLGIVLVLSAIVLLNFRSKKNEETENLGA